MTAKIIDLGQHRRKIAHDRMVFVTFAPWPEPISDARFWAELDRMWAAFMQAPAKKESVCPGSVGALGTRRQDCGGVDRPDYCRSKPV